MKNKTKIYGSNADLILIPTFSLFLHFLSIQKGKGLSFRTTQNRWIDLGIQTNACMNVPDTCTDGGGVALWYKGTQYGGDRGIFSSRTNYAVTSSMFLGHLTIIRCAIAIKN